MSTHNDIHPERDPRLKRMPMGPPPPPPPAVASAPAAGPPPKKYGTGPSKMSEREYAYQSEYIRGEGWVKNGPDLPPAPTTERKARPVDSHRRVDQFICFEHRWEEGVFVTFDAERDAWLFGPSRTYEAAVFDARKFAHVVNALDSARFLLMKGTEPSHTDFMFRCREMDLNQLMTFRSLVVDRRYGDTRRMQVSETEMDEYLPKLERAYTRHRLSLERQQTTQTLRVEKVPLNKHTNQAQPPTPSEDGVALADTIKASLQNTTTAGTSANPHHKSREPLSPLPHEKKRTKTTHKSIFDKLKQRTRNTPAPSSQRLTPRESPFARAPPTSADVSQHSSPIAFTTQVECEESQRAPGTDDAGDFFIDSGQAELEQTATVADSAILDSSTSHIEETDVSEATASTPAPVSSETGSPAGESNSDEAAADAAAPGSNGSTPPLSEPENEVIAAVTRSPTGSSGGEREDIITSGTVSPHSREPIPLAEESEGDEVAATSPSSDSNASDSPSEGSEIVVIAASPSLSQVDSSARESESEADVMEPINAGDLVIRMRQKGRRDDPKLRVDSYDVWDGPWRVERFAGGKASEKAKPNPSTQTRSSQPLKASETAKLLLPRGSQAAAWIDVKELRKAFQLPKNVTEVNFEELTGGAQRKMYNEAVKTSKIPSDPDRPSNPNLTYVAKLANGSFVAFENVSATGAEDDTFEIGHLRAKRIMLRDTKNYGDEKVDDAETEQWQKENPRIKKNKVPVVEYLVHWAGWASEDDTWERAQGNLGNEVVEEFHENRDNKCPTIFPYVQQ